VAGAPDRLDNREMPGPSTSPNGRREPALTVAVVARRLGVAPPTLRTWDRRYGLGPTEHTAGSHRRYTAADLARLEVMRRLTLQGVAPAEAARVALDEETGGADPAASGPSPVAPSGGPVPEVRRGTGGRIVPLAAATPAARGLARAAMALDAHAAYEIVRSNVDRRGVVWTWDSLLVPVLTGIGQRWEATGQGVDVEHLLSDSVIRALNTATVRLRDPVNARPVLLASAEDEQHSLPLHALAAALAERRITTRVLGPRVPRDALAAAVQRTGPAAVFVWAHLRATGDPSQLAGLPGMRPAPRVVVGGPGWWRSALPSDARVALDLPDAVGVLISACT
jgi:MerR family transcriptional regulator, light-induced transcriptional regulator